jgi:hypothetical protein
VLDVAVGAARGSDVGPLLVFLVGPVRLCKSRYQHAVG